MSIPFFSPMASRETTTVEISNRTTSSEPTQEISYGARTKTLLQMRSPMATPDRNLWTRPSCCQWQWRPPRPNQAARSDHPTSSSKTHDLPQTEEDTSRRARGRSCMRDRNPRKNCSGGEERTERPPWKTAPRWESPWKSWKKWRWGYIWGGERGWYTVYFFYKNPY